MNSKKSSQQENPDKAGELVHVLILLRSSVAEDATMDDMAQGVEEFTFITSRDQAKFLEYTEKYRDMTNETGEVVEGTITLTPVAMTAFSTASVNPIVHAIASGMLEYLKRGMEQSTPAVTNLSIN